MAEFKQFNRLYLINNRQLQKIVTGGQHEWQATDMIWNLDSGTCHRFLDGFTREEVLSTALAGTQLC